jgi:two-component system, NarL family, invasion response regulator UvrY
MLKILLTDDHALIRRGLKHVVLEAFGNADIGEAQNAEDALDQIRKRDWDVVLMDITMPGRSGIDILRDIQLARPALPVLILSMHGEEEFGRRVLKAGAAGFIAKQSAPDELVKAIRKVLAGGRYISGSLAERLASDVAAHTEKPLHESLSNREFQVMCMFASGKTNGLVAQALSLSVKTITTYRSRILEKMNLKNNAELTHYAIKNRLVE